MKTSFALIAIACLTTSGCAVGVVGAAGAVGVAAVQDKTFGQSLDDATASNELKARLLSAGAQRFAEVDVEVANGLALLSGRVSSPVDKLEAEHTAWSVGLIQDVANEIQIEQPGGIVKNVNDEWITGRVRARLLSDSRVKGVNFNIETYNGVVYLLGVARDTTELQRAAEHASFVAGVKEVVSYVQVRGQPRVRPQNNQAIQQEGVPPYISGQSGDDLLGAPSYTN